MDVHLQYRRIELLTLVLFLFTVKKEYKGRLTLEERAKAQQRMVLEGVGAVIREQVAAWLRIDERKLATRRIVKSAHSSPMKCDQRVSLSAFNQLSVWSVLVLFRNL